MTREIERKFLILDLPRNIKDYTSYEINQGYLVITDNIEFRLRRKNVKYYQTIKTGQGLTRGEYEIELSSVQFDLLWPLTEGKRVEKTRYEIRDKSSIIELDIYRGPLKGLITAEVEFNSKQASNKFQPPQWFGKEITLDSRYKNKNLSLLRIPPS